MYYASTVVFRTLFQQECKGILNEPCTFLHKQATKRNLKRCTNHSISALEGNRSSGRWYGVVPPLFALLTLCQITKERHEEIAHWRQKAIEIERRLITARQKDEHVDQIGISSAQASTIDEAPSLPIESPNTREQVGLSVACV